MTLEIKKISLLGFGFSFILGTQTFGAIYDGGAYSSKKVKEEVNASSLGPNLAPSSDSTRFSVAPTGKPYYVIGEDQKCYRGNFSKTKESKALIIYYQSPVTTEHCVYQQSFTPKPSGYSISVKDGGSCVPSHVDVADETYEWIFKADGPGVAFWNCFTETSSYGDNIDRKHKANDVAADEKPAVEKLEVKSEEKPVIEVIKSNKPIFDIAEKSAKEPVVDEKPVKKSEQPAAEKPAERPVDQPAAQALVAQKRIPTSIEPPYTLQIASFTSMEEADQAISSLKEKGIEAFAIQGKVAGTTRFRVCSGRFDSAKKARDAQGELAQKAGSKDAFVQLIPKAPSRSGATALK